MRIKICGIQNREDARVALSAGAHALGFLVGITHLAEDQINEEKARAVIAELPPFVSTVMVTHLTEPDEIIRLARFLRIHSVQIQDYLEPDQVRYIREQLSGVKIMKAIHIGGEEALEVARIFESCCDALILDSRTADRLGGTGIAHDWSISSRVVQSTTKPVILAGGLTPENVAMAVSQVRPFAVDVNSGVEDPLGRKDLQKIISFIREAMRD
jgi:phosphoribosylanthranilate isomerase